jgi:hypothetical protein
VSTSTVKKSLPANTALHANHREAIAATDFSLAHDHFQVAVLFLRHSTTTGAEF